MNLSFEEQGVVKRIESVSKTAVDQILLKLDPSSLPYIILESDEGSYIQCTGSSIKLTVEVRFQSKDFFKHYVIGKKELSKTWNTINSKVWPVWALDHEVLTSEDAINLFDNFLSEKKFYPVIISEISLSNFLNKSFCLCWALNLSH